MQVLILFRVELARAQIAFQLGKNYDQDNELRMGCSLQAR